MMRIRQALLAFSFVLFLALPARAATYTVMASGGGNFSTIQACADAAAAGDVCEVYAGTYRETVRSVRPGASGSRITFRARAGDNVLVTAFYITHSYITISGFEVDNASGFGIAAYSAHNIVVENNNVHSRGNSCILLGTNASNVPYDAIVRNNKVSYCGWNIHEGNGIESYGPRALLEGNDISYVADAIHLSGDYSVVRNNTLHDFDIDAMGSGAHADGIQNGALPLRYALIEGNTWRNCRDSGGDCHFALFQGLTGYEENNIIVRFNYTNSADTFVGVSVGGGSYVNPYFYVYHNTFTQGSYSSSGACSAWGTYATNGRAKNNICYDVTTAANYTPLYSGGSGFESDGNLPYRTGYTGGWSGPIASESTYAALRNQNPLFANFPTDGTLQSGSPARSAGAALTTVAASDTGSGTTLVLNDAGYFWPGYSGTSGDWIRIGASTVAQIVSINYSTNTITLASAVTRSPGSPVYLHKKSDGLQVLSSTRPDVGAYPFMSATTTTPPRPPADVIIR